MKAILIERVRRTVGDSAFVEIVVWALPQPLTGSIHKFKYRFALVVNGECVMRYDNERGKGDHRHIGDQEEVIELRHRKRFLTPSRQM